MSRDADEEAGDDADHADAESSSDAESDAGSDAGDEPDGAICAQIDIPVVRVTPTVLIVLDRSKSMEDNRSWDKVVDAIVEITGRMERKLAFGLMAFPNSRDPNACNQGLYVCEPAGEPIVNARPRNAAEIEDALEELDPCGGTPVAPTLRAAADYFIEYEDPTRVPSATGAGRYILLATDGAPNCNGDLSGATCRCTVPDACEEVPENCLDDVATYEALDWLSSMGVETFVLGIEASGWRDVLDEMARRGGTGQAYFASQREEILAALDAITEGLTTCEVSFAEPGIQVDPDSIAIYFDGELVPRRTEGGDCGMGWTWADDSHRRIGFCGPYCAMLREGDVRQIRATFGCAPLD